MPVDPAQTDIAAFHEVLRSSKRILALCGAGMSAASGVQTFVGKGKTYYRGMNVQNISIASMFETNPGLVWQFYSGRRHAMLNARPNLCHFALAELSKKKGDDVLVLTQNIDGLSERAGHPATGLIQLHGTILDLRCSTQGCGYIDFNNTMSPLCPALEPAAYDQLAGVDHSRLPPLDPVDVADLPHCPRCDSLLRPRTIRFGDSVDDDLIKAADDWIASGGAGDGTPAVDIILVIGTGANVFPSAGYVNKARDAGAVVVVVNTDSVSLGQASNLRPRDFFFQGDAADVVPVLLEPVIGKLEL